ncbi:MAG: sodium:proton antiporter [Lachnospiraceae bacterium]|nr:proton-conducting transporter membrane subunit [uncultured Acetatifactor sp.]MCI9220713.1 sodium:proton antiporter [Lachnospiraceae bacterium]
MAFVQNFPFMSILLSLFSGPLCSVLDGKWARRVNTAVIAVIGIMSAFVLKHVSAGQPYVYRMGHFSAPWGNEIRVGTLEAFMACFFCAVMLLCMLGGIRERAAQIEEGKQNLYYVMVNLLLCSLLALIYTNDLFTAYVFVEINTISACGLIMIRQTGRTFEAATRYMIMSLLGSGLLLLGICHLYAVTGHLLMSNIKEQVQVITATGRYHISLMVALGLMSVGLAIKSALYPFHAWLPDAYGYSTLSSSAILSSLVSKGYIFLLIKIFYRVVGIQAVRESKVVNVLFVFGIAGMIMGSLSAIKEENLKRMIAYSSVAQIGYIYMGLGLATDAGAIASLYHVLSHAATKSLLFVAAAGLAQASGGSDRYGDITGAGFRNRLAGVAFTVGSLSMVGMPVFSGFISKLLFARAAVGHAHKMLPTVIALAVSTILNAVYFMKTVIRIYTIRPVEPGREGENPGSGGTGRQSRGGIGAVSAIEVAEAEILPKETGRTVRLLEEPAKAAALVCFILLNLILGLNSDPIVRLIQGGIEMFE